jgi:hypothetical protein
MSKIDLTTSAALTLWQPWASAIVGSHVDGGIEGLKRIENRDWPPPRHLIGERIWIHAAKRPLDMEGLAFVEQRGFKIPPSAYPTGCLIGSAKIIGAITTVAGEAGVFTQEPTGLTARAREVAMQNAGWFGGPWGWILDDVRRLEVPILCPGNRRIWYPAQTFIAQARAA